MTETYNQAIKLLTRREHSRAELRQKLQQRGHSDSNIGSALDVLIEEGFLSDQRFVEMYIRSCQNRGLGPARIKMELQEKGVEDALIAEYLNASASEWVKLAKQVHAKKFSAKLPKSFEEKALQMRFLNYRGFTQEQIDEVF
ncbi:MAG: regulatory protein RecX [Gammaproteobacteria bacterium]